MHDRYFRLILGLAILLILYFDLPQAMDVLIAYLFFEGITNLRLTRFLNPAVITPSAVSLITSLDAERIWRLLVASLLLLSYIALGDSLWFFPWFMGFAIFGAGTSGVCPMMVLINSLGFK